MKLEIEELKRMAIPDMVTEFMVAHGTNHQLLLRSWKRHDTEKFNNDINLLILCLAYELQQTEPKKAIVKRIKGRISKLRHQIETAEFDAYLSPVHGMGFMN